MKYAITPELDALSKAIARKNERKENDLLIKSAKERHGLGKESNVLDDKLRSILLKDQTNILIKEKELLDLKIKRLNKLEKERRNRLDRSKKIYLSNVKNLPSAITLGTINEHLIIADLFMKGVHVFKSLHAACPCDLAILVKTKLYRVEVKSAKKQLKGKYVVSPSVNNYSYDILAYVIRTKKKIKILYKISPILKYKTFLKLEKVLNKSKKQHKNWSDISRDGKGWKA